MLLGYSFIFSHSAKEGQNELTFPHEKARENVEVVRHKLLVAKDFFVNYLLSASMDPR